MNNLNQLGVEIGLDIFKRMLLVIALVWVAGCSKPAGVVATGLNSCSASLATISRLKQQLGSGHMTARPSALLTPTNARQSDQMQALRAAAAQDQQRNRLAAELKFQSSHCQSE